MTKGPWTALADPSAPFSTGTENWKQAQKMLANLFDFDFDEDVSGRYTVWKMKKLFNFRLFLLRIQNNLTLKFI